MNKIDKDGTKPFTKEDVLAALEGYDSAWYTYPIDKMSYRSDIPIQKNKRNGRKQAEHIKLMNFVRDEINGNKDWRNKDGRPEKQQMVQEWRKQHPNGKKIECERDTRLSRHTVIKWWNEV